MVLEPSETLCEGVCRLPGIALAWEYIGSRLPIASGRFWAYSLANDAFELDKG